MNTQKNIFIGVAWPYVNGDIHLGHLAGYLLPSDIFARFNRFIGNNVLMVSGSDCFGTPIALEADKRKLKPADVVAEYHTKNLKLFKDLGLSFDLYTKTDNPIHTEVVQDVFITLLNKGLIYPDTSDQYYSETENKFLPDRYVEGTCPHCGFTEARSDQCDNCDRILAQGELINPISKLTKTPVIIKKSQHYFFAWGKLETFLETYLKEHGAKWRPWIFNEAERWLKGGLNSRAITRDLDWGVAIPVDRMKPDQIIEGHEHKRIYVWFEAVIGYLSASIQYSRERGDEAWKDFWYNETAGHYYFMGKDNLVFHTLFWPGQLHGYNEKLHLPDVPAINQFLTLGDEGFSKSRGVTLNPRKIADDFGLDLVRLYLCLIMPENHDSDFTWADFIVKTNNLVIANLGNFLFRIIKLSENLDFATLKPSDEIIKTVDVRLAEAKLLLEECKFRDYAEAMLDLSSFGNKYLSDETPWKKKEDISAYNLIMANALLIALALRIMLEPIAPHSANKLETMLGLHFDSWSEAELLFESIKQIKITNPEPLFKRIEVDPENENFNEKYQ